MASKPEPRMPSEGARRPQNYESRGNRSHRAQEGLELRDIGRNGPGRQLENAPRSSEPGRQKSLHRPERRPKPNIRNRDEILGRAGSLSKNAAVQKKANLSKPKKKCPSCWVIFSKIITFYAPRPILSCCGMKTGDVRQAWREKMALCTIIFLLCGVVGFLTFGLQQVLCGWNNVGRIRVGTVGGDDVVVNGKAYRLGTSNIEFFNGAGGMDLSFQFQNTVGHCRKVLGSATSGMTNYFPCVRRDAYTTPNPQQNFDANNCLHNAGGNQVITPNLPLDGEVYFEWKDIQSKQKSLVVYNGHVLDFGLVDWLVPGVTPPAIFTQLRDLNSPYRGTDATLFLNNYHREAAKCAMEIFRVGALDTNSMGCIISNVVLYVSLIVILGVVLTKFVFAVFFGWVLSWRLGSFRQETYEERMKRMEAIEQWSESPSNLAISVARGNNSQPSKSTGSLPITSRYSAYPNADMNNGYKRGTSNLNPYSPDMKHSSNSLVPPNIHHRPTSMSLEASRRSSYCSSTFVSNVHVPPTPPPVSFQPFNFNLAHTILLVTCYSEGADGIRTTLDSLALTDYPQSHKLILVIADGIIVGSGNDMSTPDVCLSMMKDFVIAPENVQPYSYVAIADGSKRHNMAKVYAGYYKFDDQTIPFEKQQRVPMILISKCGTPEEANAPKPGNRGKRDSQIILMSFLQHVMFDDRMTEMEYELFNAIWSTTGVSPDNFEIVLMVDADTKVYPDSVTRMVSCMVRDPKIMGLCGETKIANKSQSWVSMIQVFEYYISHHLSKAFESVFGGVTCLPGCFCMYRIKAPKGPSNFWVPVLASPDIVEHYSENVVDTLHKKNLLLLGEDRYLTTLMLKTFPKRKMIFVPQAVCKTVVPDSFRVLLSQRRRWINSTVHNLLELVLIRDLCGTFCFSMQFVIFMELIGTTVLPAAICFTIYLIVIAFIVTPVPVIPLTLLAIILGLPAILIVMTTRKLVYVGWMFIYLISLPIWNLVLPVYAFWHFDDFSWGQTRLVAGEAAGGGDHSTKEGEFDSSRITMKKWSEFEREKRRKTSNALTGLSMHGSSSTSIEKLGYHSPSQLARLSSVNLSAAQSEPDSESSYNSRGSK
ncbi:hypothetical protein K493DRAFT_24397 [Basidiobolus meristosporus CBS 931.73]|uniref:chitin synthase n=1 Tax=Basidiobolus meristosporus CBS 931.73 TaxID=1314790 RepID=A0A1Y1YC86_9FUNG|nr:hypothetical protein K493DRAFT_24397 [Basidiobolus meristosporus CBS 931.73]|eukprot:ORX95572.1 hypothetical protein K493DRAFT_24397 [Basidiobolus meristosporus CBS 931.73]